MHYFVLPECGGYWGLIEVCNRRLYCGAYGLERKPLDRNSMVAEMEGPREQVKKVTLGSWVVEVSVREQVKKGMVA